MPLKPASGELNRTMYDPQLLALVTPTIGPELSSRTPYRSGINAETLFYSCMTVQKYPLRQQPC